MENNLPQGWVGTKLSEIADWGSGGTPQSTNAKYYNGDIPWLIIGDLNDGEVKSSQKSITKLGLENSSAKLVKVDAILCAMYGSIGKLGIAKIPCATNQAIAFTENIYGGIPNMFLFYYLFSLKKYLLEIGKGGTQQNISQTVLKEVFFPLPPLVEQHRIVTKLDALFEKIESNKQRLENIPKILKRFRQSVLAAAVSGKLTEDWRKINNTVESAENLFDRIQKTIDKKLEKETALAKKKGTRKPKDQRKNKKADFHETELETLPDNWNYYRLEDITYLVTDGTHHTPAYKTEGVKFLSVKNVRPFKIRDSEIKYISEEEHQEINSRCNPEKNDILYTKVGATFGYACINELEYPFSIFVSLALIKPVYECINSKYLEAVMNSETVFKQARERISGIGTPDLHLIEIRDFKIPLCSLEEQEEIVRRLEQLFAFADKLEARYNKAKAMLDKLPQSILAKAFRGELVAQDPNDEPASVLLERIKAEKEKLKAEKKVKKTKVYSIEEKPEKIAADLKVKYKKVKD